jgi:glutaredoxin
MKEQPRAVSSPPERAEPTVSPQVVLYWRPGCAFCGMLRRNLQRAGVTLDERNIWDDPDAAAVVRSVAGGSETVPTVIVAGQALVNPPANQVLAHLGRNAPIHPPASGPRLLRRLLRRAKAP